MKAQGIARLGKDAEIHTTNSGESVVSLALAFSWGRRGDDGNRPTQWVDADFWGKRAVAVAPYLKKGAQIVAYLDELRIEQYEGRNGPGHKLAAKVTDIELVSAQREDSPRPVARPAAPAPKPAPAGSGFEDMDDDLPF